MLVVWKCPHCHREQSSELSALTTGEDYVLCSECGKAVDLFSGYFRHRTPNCNRTFVLRLPPIHTNYKILSLSCPCCGRNVDGSLERFNPAETLPGADIDQELPVPQQSTRISVMDLERGKICEVVKGRRIILGRGSAADVKLDSSDMRVSREHIALDFTGSYPVIDILGINGVIYNGKRLRKGEKVSLPPGSAISIYDIRLVFEYSQ